MERKSACITNHHLNGNDCRRTDRDLWQFKCIYFGYTSLFCIGRSIDATCVTEML